jgi:Flp pilus assembly pilin Flp
MDDLVLAWWSRVHAAGLERGERGTTVVEYLMVVALLLAAVVLVTSLGASMVGDVA